MPRPSTDKRSRLIQAAVTLAYERGFANTALSDIAREADVSLGNVYYYFKTKAEIGEAIIAQRVAEFRRMTEDWNQAGGPEDRLVAFVKMTEANGDALARSGCPVGSLCAELGKSERDLRKEANRPFLELLEWLEAQFAALGRGHEKKALALHLLAALQGVSLLANCFEDPKLVAVEADQLKKWIRSLGS